MPIITFYIFLSIADICKDPEIMEIAPRLMDVIIQRLESVFMRIAELHPGDPVLRKIPALTRQARELRSIMP